MDRTGIRRNRQVGNSPGPGPSRALALPVVLLSKRELAQLAITLLERPGTRWTRLALEELAKLGDSFVVTVTPVDEEPTLDEESS